MTPKKGRYRFFPKQHRTAQERRHLYQALRDTGLNSYEAQMCKDWRFHAIECFLHQIDDANIVFASERRNHAKNI